MRINEKKQGYIVRLRENKLIRLILFPFMNYKRKKKVKDYKHTSDSQFIKSLKDTKKGKRCFIIGNGPSLKPEDLDKLIAEDTFAFNRIYYLFDKTKWRPTYYMCVDADVLEMNAKEICNLDLPCILLGRKIQNKSVDNIHLICDYAPFKLNKWDYTTPFVSEDVSNYFCSCYTVTFEALQLAIYMGYEEIYLLGVDHNYSVKVSPKGKVSRDETIKDYFDGLHKTDITMMNYEATTAAFQAVQDYCSQGKKVRVYNATRGGKLEVFQRVAFDDVINRNISS